MEEGRSNVLIIRHLPSSLSSADKEDLLKHFGASHVRCLGEKGRMKHTAFASFNDPLSASNALQRLHQLDILGHTLVAEYAKTSSQRAQAAPSIDDRYKTNIEDDIDADEKTKGVNDVTKDGRVLEMEMANDLKGVAPSMGMTYPVNPKLCYRYPSPTIGVLTNIINALASSPRFYIQVLHLMNKMNLPAPFGLVTQAPPLKEDEPMAVNQQQQQHIFEPGDSNPAEMEVSSSSEEGSEMESDEEDKQRAPRKEVITPGMKRPAKKASGTRKRPRLQQMLQQVAPPKPPTSVPAGPQPTAAQVFDQPQQDLGKKPEFRIAESIAFALEKQQENAAEPSEPDMFTVNPPLPPEIPTTTEEPSGFGTFEPPPKPSEEEEQEDEQEEEEEEEGTEYISRKELSKNRLSSREMKSMSVYKKYDPGEPTLRLYLKNLAKQVEEKDLKFIYGRYVDWESTIDKDMFTIQLMKQGRMKGQAFVGLPSEYAAKKALQDTNGYLLFDKPIVVQFARSAKPKPEEEGKKKKK
ncbi:RNA-binding region-containing protein 3-like isoform X2 [Amphiura filiformis]|uniref:RNA-binding region-containing protein 3-like isoform X2 n=1 Tax=Amphiura filiformis TaxID=82378 RepID=UPI003B218681